MSADINLVIGPDGSVKSLYRDSLKQIYDALGELEIPGRASDIIYEGKKWKVAEFVDRDTQHVHPEGFDTRAEAIEHEIQILQDKYL